MDLAGPSSIGDIFDSALNLEDVHLSEGYNEGFTDGLISGTEEGREVGLKTGFEIGQELGFYRGCIDLWKSAILVDPTHFSTRVLNNIKAMDDLLHNYPIAHPEGEFLGEVLDSLRLKFRAICATLNVKLEYDGYPKVSGVEKNEF